MQSGPYQPVPFAVGGVTRPRPASAATIDGPGPSRHFGPEDANGFKPMFFTRDAQENDAEAQLRLDWEQATARMVAKAYSNENPNEKGTLVDLSV
ncbi:hypothetical protein [Novosphingobium mangrovi (ex Huang et al. 2023)]|uniref:Uncharacterized protein n=1 Tax=Novosphingobium mangrovi (ex Huang et al. 2023) TaxID=2976432 RepID=A0ABT2I2M6_9SPHN|nr:hypothetical protein [Novosphingobium mangrovi (ex Huang et al. 2023)]MCT2399049.1 hypothetical protein [Novosphingobium mangrovi (ex Huang et al. 2023)]